MDFSLLLGDQPPERLGVYRIIDVLGEGGMGLIYDAVREDETQLPVAIKVVRQHLVGGDATRRFVLERRILGRLKHPYICQIYDSNLTQSGQPYFVMERIHGQHLDVYCREQALTLEQRIDLFLKVCDAVAYAHQKLIIHRDLKPANILVDEHGNPKLLDFGIAGLIDPETGRQETLTREGTNRLSLGYAAPEQLNGETLSTACDIYTLGVILCQILTGVRPFAEYEHALMLMLERMRSEPAPLAGTLLRRLYQDPHRQGRRPALPRSATKKLRGDLDAVIATCLAYQPEKRYPGVAALASDLLCFKHRRPVSARPASLRYRLTCFGKRNAKALAVATVIGAMSLFYSVTLWRQWHEIQLEREMNAQTARFLQDVFSQADLFGGRNQLTIEQVLENATASLAYRYREQPLQQAKLGTVLGTMQRNMGRFETSYRLLSDAHQIYVARHGEDHPQSIRAGMLLGLVALDLGRNDEAKPLLDRAEAFFKTHPRGMTPFEPAAAVLNRCEWDVKQLQFAAAEARLAEVAAMGPLTEAPLELRTQYHSLRANLAFERDDLNAAERAFRRLETLFAEQLGPDHLRTLQVKANLASVYSKLGRTAQALAEMEQAVAVVHAKLGDNHPMATTFLVGQGNLAFKAGRFDTSRTAFEEALRIRRKVLGPDHPDTTTVKNNLAVLLRRQGEFEAAFDLSHDVLADWQRHKGAHHPDTLLAKRNLVKAACGLGRFSDAHTLAEQALTGGRAMIEENPLPAARAALGLARSLAGLNRRAEAEVMFDQAASYYHQAPDWAAKITLPLIEKAWLQAEAGDFEAAQQGAERVLTLSRPGKDQAVTHEAEAVLAWAALHGGDWDEAACLLGFDRPTNGAVQASPYRDFQQEWVVIRTLWFGGHHDQAHHRLSTLTAVVERRLGRGSPQWVALIGLGTLFGLNEAPFGRHGLMEASATLAGMQIPPEHAIAVRLELASRRDQVSPTAVLRRAMRRNPNLAAEWQHRRKPKPATRPSPN
nr:serine/threonine-protein kinase [Acanthopleuribacter pedis]